MLLGSDYETSPSFAALDPASGRLLTAGPGPDGTAQIGLSGVAFKP
ncbi:hypothetical protein [Patulibacter minatonensis]|nr:hypothetical protein [Patulibacter minatonensis]